ncbi:hypothetical protein HMI55_006609 [Coelomomyces lativittatus]|nr:hypothetical protein HMI55_006609 [Coelomomyces lativittatus]
MLALNKRQKQTTRNLDSYSEIQLSPPTIASFTPFISNLHSDTHSFSIHDTPFQPNVHLDTHLNSTTCSSTFNSKKLLFPISEVSDKSNMTSITLPVSPVDARKRVSISSKPSTLTSISPSPSLPLPQPEKIYINMNALLNAPDIKLISVSNHIQPRIWKPYFSVTSSSKKK